MLVILILFFLESHAYNIGPIAEIHRIFCCFSCEKKNYRLAWVKRILRRLFCVRTQHNGQNKEDYNDFKMIGLFQEHLKIDWQQSIYSRRPAQ